MNNIIVVYSIIGVFVLFFIIILIKEFIKITRIIDVEDPKWFLQMLLVSFFLSLSIVFLILVILVIRSQCIL